MTKDRGKNTSEQDDQQDKIKKQVKDPVSNSPSNDQHTRQQLNNDELRERKSKEELENLDKTPAAAMGSPYEMGETAEDESRDDLIIPDDPIEAEQVESEKLRFGFSFEPKEGLMGDETEDEGDLTAEQRKPGNRYKPSLGLDDGEQNNDDKASDQELHITDTGHIGMAFGEDNYVEEKNNNKNRDNKK